MLLCDKCPEHFIFMATVPVAFMCYFFPNVNYLFFFSTFVYPSGEAGGVFFCNNDLSFFGPIPSMFCLLHVGRCKSVASMLFVT